MDIQKKREQIVAEINRCKASILDHNKQIEEAEKRLFGLHGALETLDMLAVEERQANNREA